MFTFNGLALIHCLVKLDLLPSYLFLDKRFGGIVSCHIELENEGVNRNEEFLSVPTRL